jgi:putative transposase
MAKSIIRVYVHLVWATKHRRPTLTMEHEQVFLQSIKETCEGLGLRLYAANGAWDHIHLLIGWRADVCLDDAVREFKSRAWHACNLHAEHHPLSPPAPRWQRGYAALSLDRERVSDVIRYIKRQKQHHQRPSNLLESLEVCAMDEAH